MEGGIRRGRGRCGDLFIFFCSSAGSPILLAGQVAMEAEIKRLQSMQTDMIVESATWRDTLSGDRSKLLIRLSGFLFSCFHFWAPGALGRCFSFWGVFAWFHFISSVRLARLVGGCVHARCV